MYKIHTMNKISPVGLIHFDAAKYAIDAQLNDADAVILRSADMHELDYDALKSLKCVARAGAGVNNIPLPKCTDHGIVVFNTPGANANAVAELVLLGMLAASAPNAKEKPSASSDWAPSVESSPTTAPLSA